jgi:hypothetical protein
MSISNDPLFNRYSNEPVYYMAHPLAPDEKFTFNQNMGHVVEMLKFFYGIGVRVIAPYHTMCLALDDDTPEDRRVGLEVDLSVVRSLKRLILVGHKISSGMRDELYANSESYQGGITLNFTGWTRTQIKFYFESLKQSDKLVAEWNSKKERHFATDHVGWYGTGTVSAPMSQLAPNVQGLDATSQ